MVAIGMIAVCLGIVAVVYGIFQKVKAGRVADAPLVSTGQAAAHGAQVASAKGAISAQGRVLCPQPLVSPVTGTPCLFYELEVVAKWKEGETQKSKTLDKQTVATQFAIDDGSGPVWIDATKGGDFEPEQKREMTQSTSLVGGITGQELVFGSYRLQTGMLALGTQYTVTERVLPLVQNLYACGKTAQNAIVSPDWRALLLSAKSRDELLAHATKQAKLFLVGGGATFAAGSLLAIVGQLVGS